MRARYLGDHDNFASWGIRFPRGVFVEVRDAHAQKKIAGNNHFEVENSDAEDVEFIETPKSDHAQLEATLHVYTPGVDMESYSGAAKAIQNPVVLDDVPKQSYSGARRGPKPKNR